MDKYEKWANKVTKDTLQRKIDRIETIKSELIKEGKEWRPIKSQLEKYPDCEIILDQDEKGTIHSYRGKDGSTTHFSLGPQDKPDKFEIMIFKKLQKMENEKHKK